MATMKTLKFPGSSNVYEMVDATARAGVASLQTGVASLQTTVEGLEDDTAAASAAASSALTNFAGAFSASTAYTAGQYVTYTDGQFYRFTTNHAAGAWNSAHVVAVTTAEEVSDLRGALREMYTQELTLTSNNGSKVGQYNIVAGKKYSITNNTSGNIIPSSRLVENGDAVETFPTMTTGQTIEIEPEYDANYFRIYAPNAGTVTIKSLSTIQNAFKQIDLAFADIETAHNPFMMPILENGSVSNGVEVFSSTSVRSKILNIKKGSKIIKNSTAFSVMLFEYSSYDTDSFVESSTIIASNTTGEYVFESDVYARILFSSSGVLMPKTVLQNVIFELFSADKFYQPYIDIWFCGYADYLGNATIIKLDNSKTLMVDAFTKSAWSHLYSDLNRAGVKHLDYFMITHYHQDHVGNVTNLVDNGYIDSDTVVFLPPDLDTSYQTAITWDWLDEDGPVACFNEVKPKLVASGATIVLPTEQMHYNLSDSCYFVFYNTDQSVYYPGGAYASTNFNDWSMGAYLWIGNENICFTGDLGPIGQQRMVDLGTMRKANLYTATHHGWDNGNSDNGFGLIPQWINRVNPDAVISMDFSAHDNYINTIQSPQQYWCEKKHVPNYRTRVNGSMNYLVTNDGFKPNGRYSPHIRNNVNWFFYDYERDTIVDTQIKALAQSLNTKEYITTTYADLLYNAAIAFQGSTAAAANTYNFRMRVVDSGNANSFAEFLVTGFKRNVSRGVFVTTKAVNLSFNITNLSGTVVIDGAVGTLTYVLELISYSTES